METNGDSEHEAGPAIPELKPAYALASGMLWQDRHFLIMPYLILSLPQILQSLVSQPEQYLLLAQVASEIFAAVFVFAITSRWINRLRGSNQPIAGRALFILISLHFAFWMLPRIPLLLFAYVSSELKFVCLLLFIFTLVVVLRYFFYFFPVVLDLKPFQQILARARYFTQIDGWLALKALLAPYGVMLLGVSLILSLSPDGRSLPIVLVSDLSTSIFQVLCVYLSLAFCIHLLDGRTWSQQKLDPYREARLATLELQGPAWLSKLLQPRNGIIFLLIASLVTFGNFIRAETAPPPAEIALIDYEIDETILRVLIHLQDQEFLLRGMHPSFFRLANDEGKPLSAPISESTNSIEPVFTGLQRIVINEQEEGAFQSFPRTSEVVSLMLEFETGRKGDALTSLKDLYLWYRRNRLDQITFDQSSTTPLPSAQKSSE